jgi:hypothetical protein
MEGMRAKYIWSENAEKTTIDVMMLLHYYFLYTALTQQQQLFYI